MENNTISEESIKTAIDFLKAKLKDNNGIPPFKNLILFINTKYNIPQEIVDFCKSNLIEIRRIDHEFLPNPNILAYLIDKDGFDYPISTIEYYPISTIE